MSSGAGAEGAPDVEGVAAHGEEFAALPQFMISSLSSSTQVAWRSRSRMMARTRVSETAMLYIQKASAISSMPHSMVCAIEGALVRLTEAPWCRVFHHFTEK
jgi:hypothetical protein